MTNDEKELLKRQVLDEIKDEIKEERNVSDRRYAIKLIESIVFGMVGLLLVGVVGALLKLVFGS